MIPAGWGAGEDVARVPHDGGGDDEWVELLRAEAQVGWLLIERLWVRAATMRRAGISVATLAGVLGVSERTAYRRFRELDETGRITLRE
jgi:AraC-like DNA-binding protein